MAVPALIFPAENRAPKPRRLVSNDIPWMIDLSRRRFGSGWDQISAEGWFTGEVLTKHALYLPIRTSNAFLIALLNAMPWSLTRMEAIVLLLVTDDDAVWEGVQLLRTSVEWAKVRGAAHWRYWWDEGDAYILARRVGAKMDTPRYRIDLYDERSQQQPWQPGR